MSDGEDIRIRAASPMAGMVMTFVKGPWGVDGRSIMDKVGKYADDMGLSVSDSIDDGVHVRVIIDSGGSDEDYLRLADMVFENMSDYIPQMDVITEEDKE